MIWETRDTEVWLGSLGAGQGGSLCLLVPEHGNWAHGLSYREARCAVRPLGTHFGRCSQTLGEQHVFGPWLNSVIMMSPKVPEAKPFSEFLKKKIAQQAVVAASKKG